jgi:hypothetical protein
MRGNGPRVSNDPSEDRMVTWRISGDLHKLLVKVTNYLNISHNRFLTEVMRVKLHEVNDKIVAQTKEKTE